MIFYYYWLFYYDLDFQCYSIKITLSSRTGDPFMQILQNDISLQRCVLLVNLLHGGLLLAVVVERGELLHVVLLLIVVVDAQS